jgi:predicted TIM-barrel fold metal-dependent hydrolase
MKEFRIVFTYLTILSLLSSCFCKREELFYAAEDFETVEKIDAHFHYLTQDERYMKFAASQNFKILTPNWDGEYSIDEQLHIAHSIWSAYPGQFAFFGTFSVNGFGEQDFAEKTISRIDSCLQAGARGIKIWKNIGMVLQDSTGRFVMVDDPVFEPVFQYLESNQIPVMAHLGEPKDCWLPEEEMTNPANAHYYRNHPQYHMFLHPEVPSYEEQIMARDHLLEKHPELDFIGAHLGSLEWSIEELAKRFDEYPNLKVDLSARMYHLQYQSEIDREKVRDFLIKYQDRILYGTDYEVHDGPESDLPKKLEQIREGWISHWMYLCTDSSLNVKGLQLPRTVIDKIYYKNAEKYFRLP